MKTMDRLEELIKKYNIETVIGRDFSIYDRCANIIWEKWSQVQNNKKIAIYGAGIHTQEILRIIRRPDNLVCIIDKKLQGEKRFEVPVIDVSEIEGYKVDVVIISSFKYRNDMSHEIRKRYPKIKILDFYDEIQNRNLELEDVFYAINPEQKYIQINQLLLSYERESDFETKEALLQDLISAYLSIKDFTLVFKYIEKYLKLFKSKAENYILFEKELKELFRDIQEQIKNKRENITAVFCVDSLKQTEIKNMQYLSQFANENYQFECFMAEYPQTRYALQTLLTGKHTFDFLTQEERDIEWSDGELLKYLKDNKIDFRFIGTLPNDPFTLLDDKSKRKKERLLPSEIFWNGVVEILESNNDAVFFFHTGYAIHSPHFLGEWNKNLKYEFETMKELEEQYQASVNYMDAVLKFYLEFLISNYITQIVLGDHGIDINYLDTVYHRKNYFQGGRWCKEEMNAALIIKSGKTGTGINRNIVSNARFSSILLRILSEEKLDLTQIDDKELQIQILPAYNKNYIDMLIAGENYHILKGSVGVWTKEGVYLQFEDGEERYYKNIGTELEEIILNENELESKKNRLIQMFPQEILLQPKYKYHNGQIEAYENYIVRVKQLKQKNKARLLYIDIYEQEEISEELINLINKNIMSVCQVDGICVDKIENGFQKFSGYDVYRLSDVISLDNMEVIIAKQNLAKAVSQLRQYNTVQWKSVLDILNFSIFAERVNVAGGLELKHFELEHKKYFESEKILCHNIDFVITERCSLKCKDCFNLMPLYENPQNYRYDYLINILHQVEHIFDEICEFRILGGEPFVTQEVYKVVEYVSKMPNVDYVVIYTNGTIVPDGDWLKRIDKKKVIFRISNYGGISKNYDKVIAKLKESNVCYEELNIIESYWYKVPPICECQRTPKEMQDIYEDCYGRDCLTILKGNLYQCEMLANLHNLRKIALKEYDYVKLTEKDLKDVKEKTRKYLNNRKFLEGCLTCGMDKRENLLKVKPAIQVEK